MLNVNFVPARQLQKAYKSIISGVKASKTAVVLTTNEVPQAAIVNLLDLERLQHLKAQQAQMEILNLARNNRQELKTLPADLRRHANEILYPK